MAEDRLLLIRAGIRRIERETRLVKQLVAKELDSRAADHTDSPGGHTNERNDREPEGQ